MDEYFNDGKTIINSKQLVHGNQMIPLGLISNQTNFKMPFEFGALLINGVGVLVSIGLLLQFSTGFFFAGIVILAICGWNVKNILTVESHILSIDLHNGNEFKLEGSSGSKIEEISAALKEARMQL